MPMPCRGIIHHVRPGDTLFGIANMHHLSVSQLIYANPYTDVYHLTPGDELCVPIVGP
jgi:LysM repeat protein